MTEKIINNLFQFIYLRITHANGTRSHGAKFPLGQPVQEMPVLKFLLIMRYQGLEFSRGSSPGAAICRQMPRRVIPLFL